MSFYLRPTVCHTGGAADALLSAGRAVPLLGGRLACSLVEAIAWEPGGHRGSGWHDAGEVDWPRSIHRPAPAPFDRPRLMGILNVTPDSFSDGGQHADAAARSSMGCGWRREGADIVDVGGELTRPGADAGADRGGAAAGPAGGARRWPARASPSRSTPARPR